MRVFSVGAVLACAIVAHADSKPSPEERATALRSKGRVFPVGKDHYLAFYSEESHVYSYFGDAKTMAPLRTLAQSGQFDKDWTMMTGSLGLVDPRFELAVVDIAKDHTGVVTCNKTKLPIKEAAEGMKVLAKATFAAEPVFKRSTVAVGRDGTTYYFADRTRDLDDFNLYVGKRGAMRKAVLKDTVDDRNSILLVAATGTLKIAFGQREDDVTLTWTPTGKRAITLDAVTRAPEVAGDVYTGVRLGTPCDEL